jgi:hypothetical protein
MNHFLPPEIGPRPWPEHAPNDFKLRMLDVLSYSDVTPDDLWNEMRDWLETNSVRVPVQVVPMRMER